CAPQPQKQERPDRSNSSRAPWHGSGVTWRPGGPRTGALMSLAEPVLRRRLRKLRYLAGFRGAGAQWTPGCLRDAFCSYHLSHFGSIDRLIQEAGHTSLRTTKDHYLGLVSGEAAAEFWELLPPGNKGK